MYSLIKNLLFLFSAERAHHITTTLFEWVIRIPIVSHLLRSTMIYEDDRLHKNVFGLDFKNPVGLAAGFDKDGLYIRSMSQVGFGFLELGTVTPLPQVGNPRPRLFRLIPDKAIINRMGFNNRGVDHLVSQLQKTPKTDTIIGGNIGKNKDTPNEQAHEDYLICFKKLYDYVDYFVVNLSSPNTPGLRSLQEKEPLLKILHPLLEERKTKEIQRPILLKIAPDLSQAQIKDIADIVVDLGIDGIIATNTTISRSGLKTQGSVVQDIGAGGLSGAPLTQRSTQVITHLNELTQGKVPIIGVGGIHSPVTAQDKLDAGAQLVQVYSGMIYEGPWLVKRIKRALVN